MKKTFIAIFVLVTLSNAGGMYDGEQINGSKKYCYYTDGTVITVGIYDMCPMSI